MNKTEDIWEFLWTAHPYFTDKVSAYLIVLDIKIGTQKNPDQLATSCY